MMQLPVYGVRSSKSYNYRGTSRNRDGISLFFFACQSDRQTELTQVGTTNYMAPWALEGPRTGPDAEKAPGEDRKRKCDLNSWLGGRRDFVRHESSELRFEPH